MGLIKDNNKYNCVAFLSDVNTTLYFKLTSSGLYYAINATTLQCVMGDKHQMFGERLSAMQYKPHLQEHQTITKHIIKMYM